MKMISEIIHTLSTDRFSTYLTAAGHDPDRALDLYLWNAQMGEAFHTPIQAVEVALRNRVHGALVRRFGDDWWSSPHFLNTINPEGLRDLDLVQSRLRARHLSVVPSQIVAGLSFGFWVNLLRARFAPALWRADFRVVFPNLPEREGRETVHKMSQDILRFRNRISHHEPIFKRDLLSDFASVMMLLGWICPATHDWLRPHCRVPLLMRQKP